MTKNQQLFMPVTNKSLVRAKRNLYNTKSTWNQINLLLFVHLRPKESILKFSFQTRIKYFSSIPLN